MKLPGDDLHLEAAKMSSAEEQVKQNHCLQCLELLQVKKFSMNSEAFPARKNVLHEL